jgi:hypothetical protein
MNYASRLDALRRVFSLGMRDPHKVKQGPDYRPRGSFTAANEPTRDSTPPPNARTDPDRGTGELGEEDADPGRPLAQ